MKSRECIIYSQYTGTNILTMWKITKCLKSTDLSDDITSLWTDKNKIILISLDILNIIIKIKSSIFVKIIC